MRSEFTAVIEQDDEWIIAYCPEIPGANGQGRARPGMKPLQTCGMRFRSSWKIVGK